MSLTSFFRKKFNAADYLSLYRFAAAPVIVLAIVFGNKILTGSLLAISFSTDALDGYIARKKNIATSRGAKLDSLGDLLTLLLAVAAFIVFETEYFHEHLAIIAVAASLFIFQVILSMIKFGKMSSYHTYLAKGTAILIAAFFVTTPFTGPKDLLFYTTFYIGIVEAIEEIVITFILKKPKENVRGLYWILKGR